MKIELITCEAGDWEILKVDGEEKYSGHSIRGFEYLELIAELTNAEVVKAEVTDEEMEMMC